MADLTPQLNGLHLTTAEIFYHLPDYPALLQTFIWQHYDAAPDFPKLHQFVDFWHHDLNARLHSIYVATVNPITPGQWRGPKVDLHWQ